MRSPSSRSSTKVCGRTHRSIGWWRSEGRMYWVIVRRSVPASLRSRIASTTSSSVSPMPRMRFDFVTRPASRALVRTDRERSYRKPGRIRLKMRGTVSTLCASTSGRLEKTSAS